VGELRSCAWEVVERPKWPIIIIVPVLISCYHNWKSFKLRNYMVRFTFSSTKVKSNSIYFSTICIWKVEYILTIVSLEGSGVNYATSPGICCKIISSNYLGLIICKWNLTIFIQIIFFEVLRSQCSEVRGMWWIGYPTIASTIVKFCSRINYSSILPNIYKSIVCRLNWLHYLVFFNSCSNFVVYISSDSFFISCYLKSMYINTICWWFSTAILEDFYCSIP